MEHISDHDLECYYLGLLSAEGPKAEALEEHLLRCRECVEHAEESDRYVDAVRGLLIRGNFDLG